MPKKIDNIDEKILNLLSQKDKIHISELVQLYNYSLPVLRTICKDLASKYGLFYKRGILRHSLNFPMSIEKKIIAQKASSFINNGDTIFIGAGTTTLCLCRYLHKFQQVTVITNSIPILVELLKYPQITTISVGGVLQHQDQALVGEFSDIFIKNFHINKLFLGTEGIDIHKGASRSIIQKNMAEQAITNLDGEVYLLVDSSKFGKIFTWLWLPIEKIGTVITDFNISQTQKEACKKNNIRLEIVDNTD